MWTTSTSKVHFSIGAFNCSFVIVLTLKTPRTTITTESTLNPTTTRQSGYRPILSTFENKIEIWLVSTQAE